MQQVVTSGSPIHFIDAINTVTTGLLHTGNLCYIGGSTVCDDTLLYKMYKNLLLHYGML